MLVAKYLEEISVRLSDDRNEGTMERRVQALTAIEYALVVSLLASFGVVVIGGLLFGFQLSRWAEWQGILVGGIGTIAGVAGAVTGCRMAMRKSSAKPKSLRS